MQSVLARLRNTLSAIPSPVFFQAAVLLIAVTAAWPLWSQLFAAHPGLINTRGGGDSPFLLQRLHQLTAALADGHFPARWMPDANYGYGYPFYNFYAPLSIYSAALFRFLGFSYVRAILLAQVAGFVVAAWAMYQLGRRWFGGSESAGLLASAAYTLAPFHLVNLYVRGDSLAEFWAMAFYPLALLAVDNLRKSQIPNPKSQAKNPKSQIPNPKSQAKNPKSQIPNPESQSPIPNLQSPATNPKSKIALLALAFAALVLSHNISALIFTPFLLLYAFLPGRTPKRETLGFGIWDLGFIRSFLLSLVLALALSAWFWLPALAEREMAQLEPVTAGYFHYSNHFRSLDLIQTDLLFDYDVAGGRAFRMGLVQAVAAVAGVIVLSFARRLEIGDWRLKGFNLQSPIPYLLLALLIATFMITPLSRPLWEHLPLLSFTQFPWRFLSVQALAASLATAALALLPGRRYLVPAVLILLLVAALGRLRPDYLPLTDEDITAERLAQYEWFTGNIGSTVSAEYLPPTVAARPYTSQWLNTGERFQLRALAGELTSFALDNWNATRQQWQLTAGPAGATVLFPTLYWPGWQAEIDGQPAALQSAPGSGLMQLELPAGNHTVELKLGRTPVRLAAELVSLVALLATGWLLWPGPSFVGRFAKSPFGVSRIGESPHAARRLGKSPYTETPGDESPGYTTAPGKPGWKRGYTTWLPWLALLILFLIPKRCAEQPLTVSNLTWDFSQMGYLHHSLDPAPVDQSHLLGYTYSAEQAQPGDTWTVRFDLEPAAYPGLPFTPTLALVTPAAYRFPAAPALSTAPLEISDDVLQFRLSIPANAPAGLYVPRLTGWLAYTPAGQPRGDLTLRPIRIYATVQGQPVPAGPPLHVRTEQVSQRDGNTLDVQLAWLTQQPLSQPYNLSLRLTDAAGLELAHFDNQPGYGFQPSTGWPAGQWVNDWLALPLPAELAAEAAPFALTVRLYEVESGTAVLTRRLGELTWQGDSLAFRPTEPVFTLPTGISPLAATFGDTIGLRGYTLSQNGDTLDLVLYWEALVNSLDDYAHFIHLLDANGVIVAQHDAMPRNNSYPTSQWTAGEIVSDPITLDLSEVPSGSYTLALGLYQQVGDTFPRLPARDEQGNPLPDDRLLLPEDVVKGLAPDE
jgi:hypothetical protein